MSQPESRLSRKIAKALRYEKGAFVFKVHGSVHMTAGLPDLIVCHRGIFYGLEVKMPESRDDVSVRQQFVHQQIIKARGNVAVVCSVEEALDVLPS